MIERAPLLTAEPSLEVDSLEGLLGLANAIEVEAVARYDQLAGLMEARGEAATAAVFRDMREIEQRHVDWVARLGEKLQREVPAAGGFIWSLPREIAESWDSIQHSSLLTPYRALAIAVSNEERAFALYSYVAARTDDPDVACEAEMLAREELAHAAELRVKRRLAFRATQHDAIAQAVPQVATLEDFQALERRLAGSVAARLHNLAQQLEAAGDRESARLVAGLAEGETRRASDATAGAVPSGDASTTRAPRILLQEAVRRLEGASEVYEDIVAQAEQEPLLEAAQAALQRTVEGISRISARLAALSTAHEGPQQ